MTVFKCKMCGGTLRLNDNPSTAMCEFCGSNQAVPKMFDEVEINLFNRANNLRLCGEYDKAQSFYEKMISSGLRDSELFWGVVLCKFGVEYVKDHQTFERVPSCHRTKKRSVFDDKDYISAIQNADSAQKSFYEEQAGKIDEIQKKALAVAEKEKPYDVFICCKRSDEIGKRTQDSVICDEIYHQLTKAGYRAFYVGITLKNKLGREYEPYVFAALNSVRIMLVVGTKPENFNSVWVKNDWIRFLKLVKRSKGEKLMIPCYRGMEAYDLPEEFAQLKVLDAGKPDFIKIIKSIIENAVGAKTEYELEAEAAAEEKTAVDSDPLLKDAFNAVENGDWERADSLCEEALKQDSENALAYLGKLMAEFKCRRREDLRKLDKPFDSSSNYQGIVIFGDEVLKAELQEDEAFIKNRNEQIRRKEVYDNAIKSLETAETIKDFKNVSALFKSISGFKDADERAEKSLEKALTMEREKLYRGAVYNQKQGTLNSLKKALKAFLSISGWKDADLRAADCQERIKELEKERERRANEMLAAEKKSKNRKKIFLGISIPTAALCIAFAILLVTVIIPNNRYNQGIALRESGDYDGSAHVLEDLGNYKDAPDQLALTRYTKGKMLFENENYIEAIKIFEGLGEYKDSQRLLSVAGIKSASVGSVIKLGKYEQDNNAENGKESIEWVVLAQDGNRFLVASKYCLDCKPYNSSHESVTWETCSLRKWLNNDFYNEAFADDMKNMIKAASLSTPANSKYTTDGGNDTVDNVFLLSIDEVNEYMADETAKQALNTEYVKSHSDSIDANENYHWWLRSPGMSSRLSATIICFDNNGALDYTGEGVHRNNMIRPAMWVSLE